MYNYLLEEFRTTYFAMIPLSIIFQSCLGSIAAMVVLMNYPSATSFVELMACVVICMAYNAAILAQLSVKIVFNLLIATLIINTFLILLNIL